MKHTEVLPSLGETTEEGEVEEWMVEVGDEVENGEPILPSAIIRPNRLHTPQMVKELKILINEVLDEREHKRRLVAAYDDVKPLPPSYFDTDAFKHSVDEEEPPYQDWSQ